MAYFFTAYFTSSGVPLTGLSPTLVLRDLSDGSVVLNSVAMVEKGSGWYAYDYTSYDYTKDYVGYCYAGTDAADEPYKPISTGPSSLVVADAVWDEALSGHVVAGSSGAKLTTAAIGGATTGAGAISWPYVVTNAITGLPIADVDVWVSTDLAGSNVIASGRTNQAGTITFNLDAGTVYMWRQKSGYNFSPNPDTEVVS